MVENIFTCQDCGSNFEIYYGGNECNYCNKYFCFNCYVVCDICGEEHCESCSNNKLCKDREIEDLKKRVEGLEKKMECVIFIIDKIQIYEPVYKI